MCICYNYLILSAVEIKKDGDCSIFLCDLSIRLIGLFVFAPVDISHVAGFVECIVECKGCTEVVRCL